MDNLSDNVSNANSEESFKDRAVVELFIKAAVDKEKVGGCPICHRYFMIFYVLRERGFIDLIVTTFLPEFPTKEILTFSNGKHYPLVKVITGIDRFGEDLTGLECDTVDEIESLIDRFDCDEMRGRKQSIDEAEAEMAFEDLYGKFNQFLQSMKPDSEALLLKALDKVDSFLDAKDRRFLLGNFLSRADCYLLPVLQHIRVAGKYHRNFEIPTQFSALWKYMAAAYETEAFSESCPPDREIISHYSIKMVSSPKIGGTILLMGEDRNFTIPEEIINKLSFLISN